MTDAAPPAPLLCFICTGNSARSQMAEGFARSLADDRVEAASAGLEPSRVNPLAVAAMNEVGVDISWHQSKAIDLSILARATIVVTLCGDANERCPVVPGPSRRLHWDLPDPARAQGPDAERMEVFRRVRDDIQQRVRALLKDEGWL